MTLSERICHIFAMIVSTVVILGTIIDCAGVAVRVSSAVIGAG